VVERLPRKRKALGSVPSSEKKNQKKKKKKERDGNLGDGSRTGIKKPVPENRRDCRILGSEQEELHVPGQCGFRSSRRRFGLLVDI